MAPKRPRVKPNPARPGISERPSIDCPGRLSRSAPMVNRCDERARAKLVRGGASPEPWPATMTGAHRARRRAWGNDSGARRWWRGPCSPAAKGVRGGRSREFGQGRGPPVTLFTSLAAVQRHSLATAVAGGRNANRTRGALKFSPLFAASGRVNASSRIVSPKSAKISTKKIVKLVLASRRCPGARRGAGRSVPREPPVLAGRSAFDYHPVPKGHGRR